MCLDVDGYVMSYTQNNFVISQKEKMSVDSPALLLVLGSVARERKPVAQHSANTFTKNTKYLLALM